MATTTTTETTPPSAKRARTAYEAQLRLLQELRVEQQMLEERTWKAKERARQLHQEYVAAVKKEME